MAVYPNALNVCNEALSALGQTLLMKAVDTDQENATHRMLSIMYESGRVNILSSHPWNFLRTEVPAGAYRRNGKWACQMPGDCLILRNVFDMQGEVPHRRMGNEIVCARKPEWIRYLRNDDEPDCWDPIVRNLLVRHLAVLFSKPMKGSAQDLQIQKQLFEQEFARAKAINAGEDFGKLRDNVARTVIDGGLDE